MFLLFVFEAFYILHLRKIVQKQKNVYLSNIQCKFELLVETRMSLISVILRLCGLRAASRNIPNEIVDFSRRRDSLKNVFLSL